MAHATIMQDKIGALFFSSVHTLSYFETESGVLQPKYTKQGMSAYLAMNLLPFEYRFVTLYHTYLLTLKTLT